MTKILFLIKKMLEFDKTIETVFNFADKDKNTLVVITADHETGGAAIVGGCCMLLLAVAAVVAAGVVC